MAPGSRRMYYFKFLISMNYNKTLRCLNFSAHGQDYSNTAGTKEENHTINKAVRKDSQHEQEKSFLGMSPLPRGFVTPRPVSLGGGGGGRKKGPDPQVRQPLTVFLFSSHVFSEPPASSLGRGEQPSRI